MAKDAAAAKAEVVARKTDDALDEMQARVHGVMKDDDVAAMNARCGQRPCELFCVRGAGLFVDQEEVAH